MDPNQTLADAIHAVCVGDREDWELRVFELNQWMNQGGFAPDLNTVRQKIL